MAGNNMSGSNATISERMLMTLSPYEPDRNPLYGMFFPLARTSGLGHIPIAAPSLQADALCAMPPYHDYSTL